MSIDDGSENDPVLNRIFGSLGFGFALWCALMGAYGERACEPRFSWTSMFAYVMYDTLTGFVFWIPMVVAVAALSCLVTAKTPLSGRPPLTMLVAVAIVVEVFAVTFTVATPQRGGCSVFPDF